MKVLKIVAGVLLLLGGLNNLTSVFKLPNARQAAGYLIATAFFLILGGVLLYLGLKKPPPSMKVFDDSE